MNERRYVLPRELTFHQLCERLSARGFSGPARGESPSLLPDEPELASWDGPATEGWAEARLVYTFNPAVHLRALHLRLTGPASPAADQEAEALGQALGALDEADLAGGLGSADHRVVLHAVLAAGELAADRLASSLWPLCRHDEPSVAGAAAQTWADLLEARVHRLASELAGGPPSRGAVRSLGDAIARLAASATPVLAALVGADADVVAGLAPTLADCRAVFRAEVADAMHQAYGRLFDRPPVVSPESEADEIVVFGCPVALLSPATPWSRKLPGAYGDIAGGLLSPNIWYAWRYRRPGADGGLAFDGLVRLSGRWVWFPRPYRVLVEVLRGMQPAPA